MFLKALSEVENKLSEQINYLTQVTTGQPHDGSEYVSRKVLPNERSSTKLSIFEA